VSPEGAVRYWPSIAQEGSSTEISAELNGQECYSLTEVPGVGCLLATTTATLLLIHHTGQSIACRRLALPTGLLGGIGRRVSSLLWGAQGGGGGEGRLVRVAASEEGSQGELYVLTSAGLQKWQLRDDGEEVLHYESDVGALVRDAVWASQPRAEGTAAWLKLWLMDLSVEEDRAILLVAGIDQHSSSPVLQYGVASLFTRGAEPPMSLTSYTTVPGLACMLGEGEEPRQHKLVAIGDWAFVFNREGVLMVGMNRQQGEQERLASHILGAGRTNDCPLFFSSQHGVVSLTPVSAPSSSLEQSTLEATDLSSLQGLQDSLNCSITATGLQDLTTSESKTDQLKAAFLQFCKRSHGQAQTIVDELFPPGLSDPVDSSLDRLVIGLSQQLVDDFPASDPRWVESLPGGASAASSSSMSLLVLRQLEDKLSCHQFFISFLKQCGLWERLAAVTMRGIVMATSTLLAEHGEKIVAAITLRTLHQEHQPVMDQAVKMVLLDREVTASGSLTDQDHFYREISRVDEVVASLVAVARHSVSSDSPRRLLAALSSVNKVVVAVLRECLDARNKRTAEFQATQQLEYLPWTAALRPHLQALARLAVEQGAPVCEEVGQKTAVYKQVVDLADLLLDSYTSQLTSLADKPERKETLRSAFARDRSMLLSLLVERKVWEEAASLAEKYHDFDMLVRICEETGNKEKLEGYMEKFASEDFSSHVYAWYVKEGKQSRLLSLAKPGQARPDLSSFLSSHSSISWLHDIHTGKHAEASATLHQLAVRETEALARRKTQLSLAKLTILASGEAEAEVTRRLFQIENEMKLIAAQEQLPSCVLRQFGFDRESMRVLTAREMIELYIGDENTEADYIDFKKALDLLGFASLEEEDRQSVWLHIWSRSILRNTWTDIDVDNPLESVRDTVFFRLVEFAFMQGADLTEFLPKPETLLQSEELGELSGSANFKFLIQTGYEHIQRVCAH